MMRHVFILAACGLFAAGFLRDGFDAWVDRTLLPPLALATSPEILDRNGTLMRAFPIEDGRWRLATSTADVDPGYLQMLVEVEDKRFYRHAGVDPLALIRAASQALRHGRVVSGGSTLTMQTARLLENSGTGSLPGKLRQMRLALALERRLSKDQILSLYLTHAPFGSNVEGVRAASLAWFDKPSRRLTAEEAALLVALPQAPEARRPDRHPGAAERARDGVLKRVQIVGAGVPVPRKIHRLPALAPHLAHRARADAVASSGKLRTTLDAELQTQIEALATQAVRRLPRAVTAAIMVANHRSGEILAYVGSAQYGDEQRLGFVDMITAQRSPGSTLKPLIYALAIDRGLVHPSTLVSDVPTDFGGYAPGNFDGQYRGDVSVKRALQLSLNVPTVAVTQALGPQRIMAALRRSGARPAVDGRPGLAVALGGMGIGLQDLVQLYGALAQGGAAARLTWRAGADPTSQATRFVSPQAAWHIGDILAGNAPQGGFGTGQIAYKTGTSYGYRDAWAIGWDGKHVVGVWVGRADGTAVPGLTGAGMAAPLLKQSFARMSATQAPLAGPPRDILNVPNALLPENLKRFPKRVPGAKDAKDNLRVAFPPDGARFRPFGPKPVDIVLKLSGGVAPYTVLVNARPVHATLTLREVHLGDLPPGFSTLQVVDATGASDLVNIRVDASAAAFP